jgi:hypothetical protein
LEFNVTCKTSQTNMHDALYNTARKYPGGVEALAFRIGTSAAVLYNKLRRQVDTHHTSFEESVILQEAAAEAGRADAYDALHSYAWRLGHIALQLPQIPVNNDPAPILQHLCHTFKAEGDVAQAIEKSLEYDQKINATEIEGINKAVMEAVTALLKLHQMCRTKYEQDNLKP